MMLPMIMTMLQELERRKLLFSRNKLNRRRPATSPRATTERVGRNSILILIVTRFLRKLTLLKLKKSNGKSLD